MNLVNGFSVCFQMGSVEEGDSPSPQAKVKGQWDSVFLKFEIAITN